ncbi:MAG TPA: hypothetical protein VGC58_00475, partial [Candidatus Paceibacterota bacterium]
SSKPVKSKVNFLSEKSFIDENSSKTSFKPFSISHLKESSCGSTKFGVATLGFIQRLKYFSFRVVVVVMNYLYIYYPPNNVT